MSGSSKVTIPMANYNGGRFIVQAIKSVVDQTYTNWELIIVDDASTDDSLKIIEKTVKNFNIENKVKIIVHKENKGYGCTLRDAIAAGDGEIIAVVDSDDAIENNDALRKVVKCHRKNPDACLVYTNYWECNPKLKKMKQFKTRQMKKGESYLTGGAKVRHWKIFKREFYDKTEGVNPELRQTVDKDLIFKLEEVGRLIHIPESMYLYRKHNANLTRSIGKKPKKYRRWVRDMRLKIYEDAKRRRGIIK